MIGYASHSGNKKTLAAMAAGGWGCFISPSTGHPPLAHMRYAIDNGAWTAHIRQQEFNGDAFQRLVERHGMGADFIILPDIVAGGMDSLRFSLEWLPRLAAYPRLLFAVQDGMDYQTVANVLSARPGLGVFLGGSTEWKLATIYEWGRVTRGGRWYYHVGRVNTRRRVRLCAEAGANSFDGSGVAKFFDNTFDLLDGARRQGNLLRP